MIPFIIGFVGGFLGMKNKAGATPDANNGRVLYNSPIGPKIPNPVANPIVSRDVDVLARTVWGEARNGGYRGMQAVANVVVNRLKLSRKNPRLRWGQTIADVCLAPLQFSAWNRNDPNRPRMEKVTTADANFRTAMDVAQKAVRGELPDITNGADHYHTNGVTPSWSKGERVVANVTGHKFFKLYDGSQA